MIQDKNPPAQFLLYKGFTMDDNRLKQDDSGRNSIPTRQLDQLDKLGWDITALMQDLLTGKVRVPPLLTEPQEAGAWPPNSP